MSARPLERLVDAAIGETRELILDQGRPVALSILRASDEGRRARWGEAYAARVRTIDLSRRGAYLDLGLSEYQGFLPLDAKGQARVGGRTARRLVEGEGVVVLVGREAARGKNPVVSLLDEPHPGGAPARLHQPECDLELAGARPADPAQRARIDAAIEDALARTAPVPGGGSLLIDPTAALVAIDVDAGARRGPKDPERFALELNIAAAQEAARQVRLRGLGGLIAIDFVSMRAHASRKALEQALKAAFAADPWGVRTAPLSVFGVIEASRGQLRVPLHERLRDADGRSSVETVALLILREIERESRAAKGREVTAHIAPEVKAWLDASVIPWRDALASRIGVRWSIQAAPGAPRDRIDVRAS